MARNNKGKRIGTVVVVVVVVVVIVRKSGWPQLQTIFSAPTTRVAVVVVVVVVNTRQNGTSFRSLPLCLNLALSRGLLEFSPRWEIEMDAQGAHKDRDVP